MLILPRALWRSPFSVSPQGGTWYIPDAPTVNKQQHLWPEMHRCLWSQHPVPGPHSPGGSKKGSTGVEEPLEFFVGGEKLAVLELCCANSEAGPQRM